MAPTPRSPAGVPQSFDPAHQLSAPTTNLPQATPGTDDPPSLDTQETSVGSIAPWAIHLLKRIGPSTPSEAFIHSGWRKQRREVLAALIRTSQTESRIESFITCGRNSWIEQAVGHPDRTRLRCSYCGDRLCQVCASARAHKVRDALLKTIDDKPVLFITLTLCGKREPLNELVDRLYRSFKYLRNHPTWSDRIRGGAAILEVKWSDRAQRWHPHLHIIADGDYTPQHELSDAWRSITKDSFIVDIQRVKNPAVTGSYVCKYATKPLNVSFSSVPALLDEALLALKGRRMVLTFGTWYNTPLKDVEDAELADDMIDAGEWSSIGALDVWIEDAINGDINALSVVRQTPGCWERFVRLTNPPPH